MLPRCPAKIRADRRCGKSAVPVTGPFRRIVCYARWDYRRVLLKLKLENQVMTSKTPRWMCQLAALVVLGALVSGPAVAQKRSYDRQDDGNAQARQPSGNSDRGRSERAKRERGNNNRRAPSGFSDHQRKAVHEYYETTLRRGHCPPGLAKKRKNKGKGNRCEAPGHAKRYVVGRPLPRDVIFHEVPRPIVVTLGQPPRGHRYVRVSNDILMIVVGTGLVIDALKNLGLTK